METYKFFKDPKNYQTQNKVFLNFDKNKILFYDNDIKANLC